MERQESFDRLERINNKLEGLTNNLTWRRTITILPVVFTANEIHESITSKLVGVAIGLCIFELIRKDRIGDNPDNTPGIIEDGGQTE